jgi:4-hydroxy-tetrahydrodipicolinate synthase
MTSTMTSRDILSAVPVAFGPGGELDEDGTRAILRHVASSSNEGAFVLGTTGEFPALSPDERDTVAKLSIEELGGRMRVVVHVGAASTYEAVQRAKAAVAAGATELAALTPYYLPADDDRIVEYFSAIGDAAPEAKLFVYAYRLRSGNAVSPELMARLAALPTVVGAKVSEESLEVLDAFRAVVPEQFLIYTGADRELALAAGHGAQGVVSGVSAVLPKPFRALAAAADAGDDAALAEAQRAVDDVVEIIGGNMARMKAAYRLLGVTDSTVRMALTPPDHAALAEIERVVAQYA